MPFVDKKHHKALHEDIEELDEAKNVDKAKLHRVLNPTKNLNQGIAAVKKAFNVSDAEARKMIMKLMNEDIEELDEKKLTPAELKKREEIAQAIERENPDMPMPQKMAIATAQAKKVAENKEEQVLDFIQSLSEEVKLEEDWRYTLVHKKLRAVATVHI